MLNYRTKGIFVCFPCNWWKYPRKATATKTNAKAKCWMIKTSDEDNISPPHKHIFTHPRPTNSKSNGLNLQKTRPQRNRNEWVSLVVTTASYWRYVLDGKQNRNKITKKGARFRIKIHDKSWTWRETQNEVTQKK